MTIKMQKIISASRRTDIARFYYDWLQQVLGGGQTAVANPRFRDNFYTVDLRPEAVHSLVLWSKDFGNVLKDPLYLENYNLYFQYTINNYSRLLEPNVPEYAYSIRVLDGLLRKYDPVQFNIRFDPVMALDDNEQECGGKTGQGRLYAFETLCRDLRALGMNQCRVTTSYVAMYPHVRKKIHSAGLAMVELTDAQILDLFERLADIGERYGLRLYSCASPLLEEVRGLLKGACIDGDLLEAIFGGRVSKAKDTGQRKACGCSKSSDIGDYLKSCRFGCVYCYSR